MASFMVQTIFHTSLPSLSHKRFDHFSSSLPCSCSLCCDFIPLHELVWRSTWWHKYYSKNGCKIDYCTAYLIHSVIIFNPKGPNKYLSIIPEQIIHLHARAFMTFNIFLCRHDYGKFFQKIQSYSDVWWHLSNKVSGPRMGKCGLDSIFAESLPKT